MLILDAFCPAYAESSCDRLPYLSTVECPPLPAAVIPAESKDYLTSTGMTLNIFRHVQDNVIDDDP